MSDNAQGSPTRRLQVVAPEPDLLPCPFCGGEVRLIEGDESAYIQCMDMKMHRALWFQGDNNAAGEVREQWNRRVPSPIKEE